MKQPLTEEVRLLPLSFPPSVSFLRPSILFASLPLCPNQTKPVDKRERRRGRGGGADRGRAGREQCAEDVELRDIVGSNLNLTWAANNIVLIYRGHR